MDEGLAASKVGMQVIRKRISDRNNRGISIVLMGFVLASFMLMIDFFVFNIVQIMIIEREINGICEAASLAGTSVLSRMDTANDDTKHSKLQRVKKVACRCAENMILRSSILNNSLNKAVGVIEEADLGENLKSRACHYVVKVNGPEPNTSVVNMGYLAGRTVNCYMCYGYSPTFLDLGMRICYPIFGRAVGGLPQIDCVLVFDLSCSMDDQTVVTFVRREWIHSIIGKGNFAMGDVSSVIANPGIIQYISLICPTSPHTIANYLGWDYDTALQAKDDGCMLNALPPQNLDKACNHPHGAISHPMYFDAYLRSHYSYHDSTAHYRRWEGTGPPYHRGCDFGTPPGNCDLGLAVGGNGDSVSLVFRQVSMQLNAFTDMTWQEDNGTSFNYQPAAPGAAEGLALNDPIPSPDQRTFTDVVVNITPPGEQPMQGSDNFIGFSYTFPTDDPDPLLQGQDFNFPNIAVVVEAARGNLEASPGSPKGLTNAQMALIDRPVSVDGTIFNMTEIAVKDGYQKAYQRLAMLCVQPLASLLAAADQSYLEKLHQYTDCRLGLVTFSNGNILREKGIRERCCTIGTIDEKGNSDLSASNYVFTGPYSNPLYTNATYDCGRPTASGFNNASLEDGEGMGFRMPRLALDAENDHYLDCVSKNKLKDNGLNDRLNFGAGANGIYNSRVASTCDTAEALDTARRMFHSRNYNTSGVAKNRIAARHLIIFFVDGEPTDGVDESQGQETLKIAGGRNGNINSDSCQSDGIAVFTIGLNLVQGNAFNKMKERQAEFLGDQEPTGGQGGGIAWRAGHSSRYYPCESLKELKPAFSDIARRFVQSQL